MENVLDLVRIALPTAVNRNPIRLVKIGSSARKSMARTGEPPARRADVMSVRHGFGPQIGELKCVFVECLQRAVLLVQLPHLSLEKHMPPLVTDRARYVIGSGLACGREAVGNSFIAPVGHAAFEQ